MRSFLKIFCATRDASRISHSIATRRGVSVDPCFLVAQKVTSQLGAVDMTETFLSPHRRLVLDSDPRGNNSHFWSTAHFAPFLCRFPVLHGSGAGILGIGILIFS